MARYYIIQMSFVLLKSLKLQLKARPIMQITNLQLYALAYSTRQTRFGRYCVKLSICFKMTARLSPLGSKSVLAKSCTILVSLKFLLTELYLTQEDSPSYVYIRDYLYTKKTPKLPFMKPLLQPIHLGDGFSIQKISQI